MKKIYRNDMVLLCVVLLLCAFVSILLVFTKEDSTKTAVISHDGHVVCKIALEDEGYFEVNGVYVVVKNMEASVVSSTCPDQICTDTKAAKNVGDSIICVPNKVSVKILGDNTNEEDIVIAG